MVMDFKDPSCYNKAMLKDDKLKWEKAMQSKLDLLHKNSTQELVQLPIVNRIIPCKWIVDLQVEGYKQC